MLKLSKIMLSILKLTNLHSEETFYDCQPSIKLFLLNADIILYT